MRFSIIIPTYNRCAELRQTLLSVAELSTNQPWEVVVVDNNSTDDTPAVVKEIAGGFPVELKYIFESEQGRSAALNAGIRTVQGEIIAVTDDDVRLEHDWLEKSAGALELLDCDYVGGKALPIWGGPRPRWLPDREGKHWAVIALLDYGPEPIELGERALLGVNMVFRRHAFTRAGLWDNTLGRRAGTLLGQEVREWCQRARRAGLRGFYSPDLVVHHIIPTERLSKKYFRQWFYWHGISRAILYETKGLDMESPERTTLDFSVVPHIAGIPRYLFRTCLQSFFSMISAFARRDIIASFEYELWIWFFAGIVKQRWKNRRNPIPRRNDFGELPTAIEQ